MSDKLNFYLKNTSFECPICKYHTGKLWEVKNPPKSGKGPNRVGHIFIKCSNEQECKATTFFGLQPPKLSKNGTIGNQTIGEWKAWDSTQGPKNLPPVRENTEGYQDTYLGKRKREEAEEEEEGNAKKKLAKMIKKLLKKGSEEVSAETLLERLKDNDETEGEEEP